LPALTEVIIYTDGAALGNPGPSGYGVVLLSGNNRAELSCGFRLSTNNRMELLAVIMGLQKLTKPCQVNVYSDSKYVCDAINKDWIGGWQRRSWKKVKNTDLWKALLPLLLRHKVRFNWVKGHAGIPENERCDYLASTAAKENAIEIDKGYEDLQEPKNPGLF
jgi:ribonuclease HI